MNISHAIARVYAEALTDLGEQQGSLARIVDDLHACRELFEEHRDFREFFTSPRLDPAVKKRILNDALGDKLDRPVMGLLHVLIDKRREMVLDNIVDEFDRYKDIREGRLHAYVTSATPLNADQLAEISSRLATATGRIIKIHEKVDRRILGGLIVKLGDKVLDGSIRRKLAVLRRDLVAVRG